MFIFMSIKQMGNNACTLIDFLAIDFYAQLFRAYLEFQRPLKSHGHDNVNGVIDPVYIALKKR